MPRWLSTARAGSRRMLRPLPSSTTSGATRRPPLSNDSAICFRSIRGDGGWARSGGRNHLARRQTKMPPSFLTIEACPLGCRWLRPTRSQRLGQVFTADQICCLAIAGANLSKCSHGRQLYRPFRAEYERSWRQKVGDALRQFGRVRNPRTPRRAQNRVTAKGVSLPHSPSGLIVRAAVLGAARPGQLHVRRVRDGTCVL